MATYLNPVLKDDNIFQTMVQRNQIWISLGTRAELVIRKKLLQLLQKEKLKRLVSDHGELPSEDDSGHDVEDEEGEMDDDQGSDGCNGRVSDDDSQLSIQIALARYKGLKIVASKRARYRNHPLQR
ncbi:hypothetical protein BGX28_006388 [Mortierella sp. GBA30]|nr:hypothetical protein BGX28_006388 [Mortierella sp. GBA30]